jgi:hypothetical protein
MKRFDHFWGLVVWCASFIIGRGIFLSEKYGLAQVAELDFTLRIPQHVFARNVSVEHPSIVEAL